MFLPNMFLPNLSLFLAFFHANRDEMDAATAAEEAGADRLEREHRESRKNG